MRILVSDEGCLILVMLFFEKILLYGRRLNAILLKELWLRQYYNLLVRVRFTLNVIIMMRMERHDFRKEYCD